MDILKKINNVLEASKRKATAQEIAKARIPTVGHMRPKEVGKKDRVKTVSYTHLTLPTSDLV